MRAATLTMVVVLALGGAGSLAASSSFSPQVYYLASSGRVLVAVQPSRTLTPKQALNRLAVATPLLRQRGLRSPFPVGSKATDLAIAGGTATVTLTGSRLMTLNTIPRLRLIGAVAYTLTSYRQIRTVHFMLGGQPWGVYDHSGQVIRTYQRGSTTHPWLTACAPADGCFSP